jgi:formylmethanofuran dehydrogenase subunit A
MLGLAHKGHLGAGADGDITIYTPSANRQAMFELPRYVIKAGEVVCEQGEIRREDFGTTLHVAPAYDEGRLDDIRNWFESYYTIQFANYAVDPSYLRRHDG